MNTIDDKERCEIVFTSDPINITAMKVMLPGETGPRKIANKSLHTEECPLLRTIPRNNRNKEFIDLTGRKYGKLIVVGLFNDKKYINENLGFRTCARSLWVVRCICGWYETRTTKSIKKAHPESCCFQCDFEVRGLRNKDFKRQYGYNIHEVQTK
jgi:hypothetical protein